MTYLAIYIILVWLKNFLNDKNHDSGNKRQVLHLSWCFERSDSPAGFRSVIIGYTYHCSRW